MHLLVRRPRGIPKSVRLLVAAVAIWSVGCSATTELVARAEPLPPRPVAAADSISGRSVLPNMDTYVNSDVANRNYGGHDTLLIQKNPGKSVNRILVSFPQAGITDSIGADSLLSATLELTIKSAGNDWGTSGRAVALHRMTRDWLEGGATWSCANDLNVGNLKADCPGNTWSMPGTTPPFVTTPVAQSVITNGQSGVVRFDVTSDVRAFLANQAPNQGWMLKLAAETQTGTVVFHARESTLKPHLVLSVSQNSVPVPALPPDSVPSWFRDDSSFVSVPGRGRFLRGVVSLLFVEGATQVQRQEAVSLVQGEVIGGEPAVDDDGFYYVRVQDDGTGAQLQQAADALNELPQVEIADLIAPGGTARYQRPNDGAGFQRSDWQLHPDSARDDNWNMEAIAAPFAWGCGIGDQSVRIAVLDHAFESFDLAGNVVSGATALGRYPNDPVHHGTAVAGLIAAEGNNGSGVTGVMWKAGLHLVELGAGAVPWGTMATAIARQAKLGVRIVNLSYGYEWDTLPTTADDSMVVKRAVRAFTPVLKRLKARNQLPLVVLSAGNQPIDAYWNVLPALRDSFPETVLVIAGSARRFQRADSSNVGPLIDIFAPGEFVSALDGHGGVSLGGFSGSSFAAPLASGTAGLAMNSDPSLTASDLKTLILSGAIAGNHSIPRGGVDPSAAPVLNAYESLKLVAQRPGAAVCGNRIWQDGDAITVERKSGVDEVLWHTSSGSGNGPETPAGLGDVYHGGHKIFYSVQEPPNGGLRMLAFEQGLWQARDLNASDTGSAFGATLSARGRSHDGDTATFIRQSIGNGDAQGRPPTATIFLRVGAGQTQQLTTLTGFAANFIRDDPVAFPPQGNKLLVPMRPGDGSGFGVDFYAVDLTTHSATALWSVPSALNLITSISEDGSEAIVTYRPFPATACTAEFRSLPSGTLLRTLQLANPLGGSGCGKQATSSLRVAKHQ